jgi:signal transduction histidine kinase
MLRQVLLNLVGNGYQAMLDGGELTVRASADDTGVRISVVDSGSGMDEETRSRLFEPFFTTKARGVGLGLAVSKRIVEAHSGDIEVESVVDHGTTFTVVLHAAAMPKIAAQRTADPSETAVEAGL